MKKWEKRAAESANGKDLPPEDREAIEMKNMINIKEYCKEKEKPARNPFTEEFDSLEAPEMHVVYQNFKAYPLYLITYTN